MRKSILRTAGFTAIAALICAGCTDVSDDGKTGNSIVDSFLGLYTVAFAKNGNYSGVNGSAPAAIIVIPGDSIKIPDKGDLRINDRYIFDGWNTSQDGKGANYAAGSYCKPAGDVTLYTKWIYLYKVSFSVNNGTGTAPADTLVMPGDSIKLPSDSGLTRSDYKFGGWTTKCTNCSGLDTIYAVGSYYTPANDRTLYAKWDRNLIYKVTFSGYYGNSNYADGTVPAAMTADSGSSITLPDGDGLTRSNHYFGGWNTNYDGYGTNYAVGSTYKPTGNVTLYAKWNALYSVTFSRYYDRNNNSASGTAPATIYVMPGDSVTLPDKGSLTRSDYVFGGWSTSYDGTGTNYAVGSTFKPTGSNTLYVKWIPIYKISFSGSGGTGTVPAAMTADSGSSITLPDGSNLTMSGYVFGGWHNGNGTNYAVGSTYKPAENVTLYAKWNRTYSVTFSVNGGNGTAPAAMIGDTITVPNGNGLTKSGYNFGGWYTAKSGVWTNYSAGSRFAPENNAMMYAQWDNSNVNVTTFVDSRDGKTYKKVTIGSQTWMAENLDYDDPNNVTDVCYDNKAENCAKYGRLYNWSTAMGIDAGYNNSTWGESDENHQGACPSEWHLPSKAEWDTLIIYVGGSSTAGTKLKSSAGWSSNSAVGTDDYGFSALPQPRDDGTNSAGYWWSATESYYMSISSGEVTVTTVSKTASLPVRCVADADD
jgi:uncharacterized protein (TIGR02145 family)/uncharacterized repeat protein (TIGR02543 family)